MSAVVSPSSPAIDLAAVKSRQQAAWSLERPCIVRLGEIIVAAIRDAAAIARRAHARHRERRRAMAVYEALRRLDDRTLRDIGYDRSEILSIAPNFAGKAERNRAHGRNSINEVQYEQR